MTKILFIDDVKSVVTSTDSFGSISEEIHDIKGFSIVDESEYYNFIVSFTPLVDKTYYLLYAVYTESDSYSSVHGKIDLIEMYQSFEDASINARVINSKWNQYQIEITEDSGKKYKYSPPWDSMSSLTSIEVIPVTLHQRLSLVPQWHN